MKAIILSAGQGSRLGHIVDDRPKCLIEFNGRTLLDRQLDTLEANGVHEAVVVTGFHDDTIEEALARRTGGPSVRTIFNPFYKVADNTGSLYMAREELSGATFTVSSLGPMGGITSTPVVNPPQVAIVAVNKIEDKLVPVDADIEVRKRMNLSLSCDHRVVDGWDAASFMQTLKPLIENPLRLLSA